MYWPGAGLVSSPIRCSGLHVYVVSRLNGVTYLLASFGRCRYVSKILSPVDLITCLPTTNQGGLERAVIVNIQMTLGPFTITSN